ncbi:hypothetical protein ALC62_10753, partial [Cyphomyrmex costatus]
VASPPDRRVTRDDIGVASAGVAVNNTAATSCSSVSGASSRSRNPSSSPGRNGQLSSKFPRYYPLDGRDMLRQLDFIYLHDHTNVSLYLCIIYRSYS